VRLSLSKLAKKSGITKRTIVNVIYGYTQPLLKTGLFISRALGISPWVLLKHSERVRKLVPPERRAEMIRSRVQRGWDASGARHKAWKKTITWGGGK